VNLVNTNYDYNLVHF